MRLRTDPDLLLKRCSMMKIIDKSFLKFLLVGIFNTTVSFVLMFYLEGLGYWLSTAIAYIVGAVISFFLNMKYTFQSKEKWVKAAVKFAINVTLCYIIAYSVAKPLMAYTLLHTTLAAIWVERITKIFAMGLYTIINYLGQKFITFNSKI